MAVQPAQVAVVVELLHKKRSSLNLLADVDI